ncbi:hypothetical protein B0H21DRAFT_366806 [Amylocystis lapponica]|nr:hypothetical protein B0H21DRAFT_366806 [Amylocystis lapponica]
MCKIELPCGDRRGRVAVAPGNLEVFEDINKGERTGIAVVASVAQPGSSHKTRSARVGSIYWCKSPEATVELVSSSMAGGGRKDVTAGCSRLSIGRSALTMESGVTILMLVCLRGDNTRCGVLVMSIYRRQHATLELTILFGHSVTEAIRLTPFKTSFIVLGLVAILDRMGPTRRSAKGINAT